MIKCPRCGYEQPYIIKDEGKRYRDAVEKRLVEYGYPEKMNPQKHQAAMAVRKVIALRTGISCKAGGGMNEGDANRVIAELELVLPKRAKESEVVEGCR